MDIELFDSTSLLRIRQHLDWGWLAMATNLQPVCDLDVEQVDMLDAIIEDVDGLRGRERGLRTGVSGSRWEDWRSSSRAMLGILCAGAP